MKGVIDQTLSDWSLSVNSCHNLFLICKCRLRGLWNENI